MIYPVSFRPLGDGERFTAYSQSMIVAFVAVLFLHGGPSAITRFISFGVVDAVETCSGWAQPHVIQEVLETSKPSFANSDASSAVSGIGGVLRVQATPPKSRPSDVLRSPVLFNGGAVSHERMAAITPTTGVLPRCQPFGGRQNFLAAFAHARPHDGTAPPLTRRFDGRQVAEALAGKFKALGWSPAMRPHLACVFSDQASAASLQARLELISDGGRFLTAFALAQPSDSGSSTSAKRGSADFGYNSQLAELLSGKVNDFRHSGYVITARIAVAS